jgi:hypothetical protein
MQKSDAGDTPKRLLTISQTRQSLKSRLVFVSGYTETDTNGILSPPTVWRQQSEFVSNRQSGQMLAAVRIGLECRYNEQNGCRFKCSQPHVLAMYIQTNVGLLCCVGSGSNVAVPLGCTSTVLYSCMTRHLINLLAPEFYIHILAHPVSKI